MAQPFLRWAGSKRKLVPTLKEFWTSNYQRYVEPFAGSACLFFEISPSRALLGDVNIELINAYRHMKRAPYAVLEELKSFKSGRKNYYEIRGLDINYLTPLRRAARFIYLNRYCFNGIYRTNKSGLYNVPYGGDKNRFPSNSVFLNCSDALKKAKLISGDYKETLDLTCEGDFVYLDPPFSVKNRRIFTEYDATKFGLDEIFMLRQWMKKLRARGVSFLVSYAASKEARFLKDGFEWDVKKVQRTIASFSHKRKMAYELLIYNNRA
ncbi:MAG: Dam family site-specific DNA-(adenine-N6)-methyltransferase [Anaerolineales bacterium]